LVDAAACVAACCASTTPGCANLHAPGCVVVPRLTVGALAASAVDKVFETIINQIFHIEQRLLWVNL